MYKPSEIVLKITDYPRYLLIKFRTKRKRKQDTCCLYMFHNVFVFKAFSYFMHLHQKTIMH